MHLEIQCYNTFLGLNVISVLLILYLSSAAYHYLALKGFMFSLVMTDVNADDFLKII